MAKTVNLILVGPDDAGARVAFAAIMGRAARAEIVWHEAFSALRAYCRLRSLAHHTLAIDISLTKGAIVSRQHGFRLWYLAPSYPDDEPRFGYTCEICNATERHEDEGERIKGLLAHHCFRDVARMVEGRR